MKLGKHLRVEIGISCLSANRRGLTPLKVENESSLGYSIWNNDLFKCKYGNLGCDLSIGGVERDLTGLYATVALLIGHRDNLFLFLLALKTKS